MFENNVCGFGKNNNIKGVEITNKEFENIYGYEDVKSELNLIYSWITNQDLRNDKRVTLPRGIIFYGEPGCGKSLFVKSFVEKINAPAYYINSSTRKSVEDVINDAFQQASQQTFSVIVIDEFDILIEDRCVKRTLQTKMDGVDKNSNILFLATTNYLNAIPDAFLRPGRFDKQIRIATPDKDSRAKLFNKYLEKLDIHISETEIKHIANYASRVTCADVMAICNDAYLRCGTRATAADVEQSYDRINNRSFTTKPSPFLGDKRIAIHEAGHAIMTLRYAKDFNLYKVSYTEVGGLTETYEVNEKDDCIEKRQESMKIGLAGYIAEEVILGYHDIGSVSDIDKVRSLMEKLITRTCLYSINDYIRPYDGNERRFETPMKRAHIERVCEKELAKYIKEVRKFITSHKKEVIDLANLLMQKGQVTSRDIEQLVVANRAVPQIGSLIASYARSVREEVA